MRLRLATWNLWENGEPWHYTRDRGEVRGAVPGSRAATARPAEGVWSHRRALIEKALEPADVDIVALQEVGRDPVDGTARSDELAAALQRNASGPTAGGLAVLSRHRATFSTVRLTARHDGYGSDEALHAMVTHPEGDVDILVVHLSPRSAESRVESARALVQYIDRLPVRPIAVMGDFNTVDEDKPELDVLRRAGLRDASPGCAAAATMPSHDPIVRLDYVFVGRGLIASGGTRIGDEPDSDGYYPSDHLGVLVDARDQLGFCQTETLEALSPVNSDRSHPA